MRLAPAVLLLFACSSPPRPAAPAAPPVADAPAPAPAPPAVDLVELHQRWYAAANASDWDALIGMYADDASVTPASSGSTLSGKDNILSLFKSFGAGFPDMASRPLLLVIDGNRLIAVTHNQGTNTVSLGAMPATGKPTSFLGLSVTEVDPAGKITRQVLYADNLNFMGQLGLWPGKARPVQPAPEAPVKVARTGKGDAERDNAGLVRALAALFGSHDAAGLTRLYAGDAVLDDQSAAAPAAGAAAIEKSYAELFTAFPDAAMTDLAVTTAGDLVVVTYQLTGTHGGAWPRLGARSGTMRQLDLEVAAVYRIADGKIVSHQIFADGLAAAMQLGLFEIPGGPAPEVKPAAPPRG